MNKTFCDRCKKDLGSFKIYEIPTLEIKDMKKYATNDKGINYNKTLCPSCAIDIMNIVDIECDKYELETNVKEVNNVKQE